MQFLVEFEIEVPAGTPDEVLPTAAPAATSATHSKPTAATRSTS